MENKKISLYIIGILAAVVIVVFVWRMISVQGLEKRMAEQRVALTENAQQLLSENSQHFLRLTTIPLVWAVRKEMIGENYGQINEYFTSFVKERNMQGISLIKTDGTIAVATDKKFEGASAQSVFPQQMLEQNDVTITEDKEGNFQVAAPIMDLNSRLGTLILIYKAEKVNLETKSPPDKT